MVKTMTCLKAIEGGGIANEARENAPVRAYASNTPPPLTA